MNGEKMNARVRVYVERVYILFDTTTNDIIISSDAFRNGPISVHLSILTSEIDFLI